MLGEVKPLPMPLNVMVGLVVCATKLYQTSLTTVPAQLGAVIVAALSVEACILPAVILQVVPEVRRTAPAQLSFAGGGSVIQILKVAATLVFE